jgi:metallo-beta-lactamase family protein
MLKVQFCGAARTVTGSQYYFEYQENESAKVFRFCVDSGMFQVGQKVNLFKINSHLLFDPKQLDCIVLTHAHLDHCGRIPYLVKNGFGGRIYSTPATKEIAYVVMADAARHQENGMYMPDIGDILGDDNKKVPASKIDTEKEKENGAEENLVLYTSEDVEATISRFKTYQYHEKFKIHPNLEIEFWDAGHILGSAFLIITELSTGKVIAMSGDMGNINKPIIEDPELPSHFPQLTHIFTETTYGNRLHGTLEPKEKLRKAVYKTLKRKAKVLIPSFSVERAQEIIYYLVELMRENKIPQVPIYLDSPMANKVLEIVLDHPELYDQDMRDKIQDKEHPLRYNNLQILETPADSKTLNNRNKPCVIIAGSGMLTGGRILKHLMFNIDNPNHTLIFVGYQATGTLGREILDGATEIEIEGKVLAVRNEIAVINEFSAHADQLLLKKWVMSLVQEVPEGRKPPVVFLMHGEKEASLTLGQELEGSLRSRVDTYWPHFGEWQVLWE